MRPSQSCWTWVSARARVTQCSLGELACGAQPCGRQALRCAAPTCPVAPHNAPPVHRRPSPLLAPLFPCLRACAGEMHFPYEWVPYIVEIQILRVGQLAILCVPGEFTTMAGRRLKRAVADVVRGGGGQGEPPGLCSRGVRVLLGRCCCAHSLQGALAARTHNCQLLFGTPRAPAQVAGQWGEDLHLVIAGLSNTYSSYITTFEEYHVRCTALYCSQRAKKKPWGHCCPR